jgi:hypothetical protein
VQPRWKWVWWFLKKLKPELPYDPATPFLSIYTKKCQSAHNGDTCILMFIAARFTIAKLCNQPGCPPISEWIKKTWCAYIIVALFSHKEEWNYVICRKLAGTGDHVK